MNQRMLYFLLFLFFITGIKGLKAQQKNIYIDGMKGFATLQHSRESANRPDVAGTPYYNKDWMYGEMMLKDSTKIKTVFKYNVYSQQLEFVYQKDTFAFAKPLKMDYLSFAGKTFVYALELDDNPKTDYISGGYFEVLNENFQNGCQLLAKLNCSIEDRSFSQRVMGGVGSDSRLSYVINRYYYIRKNDGAPAVKLKKSKDFLISFLGEKYSEKLNAYIKQENISISKINEIANLIDYYNTISVNNLADN